ncbi:GPCR kinase [Tanacetum coccineum]
MLNLTEKELHQLHLDEDALRETLEEEARDEKEREEKIRQKEADDEEFMFGIWVKSCYPNAIGDLTVTMKDLSGTIPGTIHYKAIGDDGYGKDNNVGTALILANISVFSPKPSMHYLNITMRNVVKVFCKDTVPDSGSVKSCYPNAIGDLTVTMKDLSGTIPGTIHYKAIGDGGYGKDITVGAALILANI